jgi:hypothetical protein
MGVISIPRSSLEKMTILRSASNFVPVDQVLKKLRVEWRISFSGLCISPIHIIMGFTQTSQKARGRLPYSYSKNMRTLDHGWIVVSSSVLLNHVNNPRNNVLHKEWHFESMSQNCELHSCESSHEYIRFESKTRLMIPDPRFYSICKSLFLCFEFGGRQDLATKHPWWISQCFWDDECGVFFM